MYSMSEISYSLFLFVMKVRFSNKLVFRGAYPTKKKAKIMFCSSFLFLYVEKKKVILYSKMAHIVKSKWENKSCIAFSSKRNCFCHFIS